MNTRKKAVIFDAIFVTIMAVCAAIAITCCTPASAKEPAKPAPEATSAPVVEEKLEAECEPTDAEQSEANPPVTLYNVPLDEGLQLFIIGQAEANGIDPAIIFAMAFKESTYNPYCIGDSGRSYGLLQVQPRWHYARMQKLGCTDLLDPQQNVLVAIDFLCELLNRYDGDMAKALVAYNAGSYKGTITYYARSVMAKAEELDATSYSKAVA